jgi:hypothetical protein
MSKLSYSKRNEGIHVCVTGDRGNLSWAIIDPETGNIVRECKRSHIMPGLTEAQIEEAVEAIRRMSFAPFEGAYIRFNALPSCGRSTNHATGEDERGISCYEATWDLLDWCYRRTGGGLDGAALSYLIEGADIYLVTGTEVGYGSDGEPVLADVEIVASLEFDAAKNGYVIVNA